MLQIVVVVQNANHETESERKDEYGGLGKGKAERADQASTAAQRLAKLSNGSMGGVGVAGSYAASHSQASYAFNRKSARKQSKVTLLSPSNGQIGRAHV